MWLERWHRRQTSLKVSLRKSYLFRIWGRRLFTNVLWRTDKRSIAGGLALGLFLAFTPTIPFQMILAVAGGLYFHVNLPIALAACWITNPLTAVPIYAAAWRLGQYVAESAVPVEELLEAYRITGRTGAIVRQGLYLWTGSLIFSLTAAITANVVVRVIWRLAHKLSHGASADTTPPPKGRT